MMKDCAPALDLLWRRGAARRMLQQWPEAPPQVLFDEIFASPAAGASPPSPAASEAELSEPTR